MRFDSCVSRIRSLLSDVDPSVQAAVAISYGSSNPRYVWLVQSEADIGGISKYIMSLAAGRYVSVDIMWSSHPQPYPENIR